MTVIMIMIMIMIMIDKRNKIPLYHPLPKIKP